MKFIVEILFFIFILLNVTAQPYDEDLWKTVTGQRSLVKSAYDKGREYARVHYDWDEETGEEGECGVEFQGNKSGQFYRICFQFSYEERQEVHFWYYIVQRKTKGRLTYWKYLDTQRAAIA